MTTLIVIGTFLAGLVLRGLLVVGVIALLSLPFALFAIALHGAEKLTRRIVAAHRG